MTSPILALRGAILGRCQGDATLAALMDGAVKIYDEPPRAAEPLYIVFGDVRARDWSTGSDRGHEQEVALVVWGKPGSARSALLVAERLAALFDDVSLALDGHRLVNLRVTAVEGSRDAETNLARVAVRFRAVTEMAG